MVLGVGFLLLVSMVLTTMLGAASDYLSSLVSLPEWVLGSFHFLFSFAFITLLFALIYKVLPDVKIRWRDVWTGAIVCASHLLPCSTETISARAMSAST